MSETPVPSTIPSSSTLSGPTNSPQSQPTSHVSNATKSLGASNRPSRTNVTESPEPSNGPSGGVDQSTTDKCLGIIKEFEHGTRSKMWAWFGIQNTVIRALGEENKERRNAALSFYPGIEVLHSSLSPRVLWGGSSQFLPVNGGMSQPK
ncbi:hypothetical protein K435DRAFT_870748 [Dendrothele bispora CBS 962.96]|uniref:Uncharacterized protein n=1 Tax=Dendrothele bispora (strain CBS 962.96) TaxID=1314807 RepID=A0A4S8L5Y5_DENBC|nr:hypothetical protein K435DRAFT_870748 [Dendrothele bispora CBS 962.96]